MKANIKIYILTALMLSCITMLGCISEQITTVNPALEELYAFWNKQATILDLFDSLEQNGFYYRNEADDLNYYFDAAPPPEKTQIRQWSNCTGYARYTCEYIKYKRNCKSYKTALMFKRNILGIITSWHYVNVIVDDATNLLEQSNANIRRLNVESDSELAWIALGYSEYHIIDSWTKESK